MRQLNPAEPRSTGLTLAHSFHDCLAGGFLVVNAAGQISTVSPGTERLLGRPATQLLGRSLNSLPAALRKAVRATSASGQPAPATEFGLKRAGAAETTLRATVTPLRAGRKCSGAVVLLNDISPIKRLEENLRRLDRLANLGTLTASLAHEIKNALVAVKTFLDLLLEKGSDAELAQTVGREIRRIDAIVSQMLRFGGPAQPALGSVHVHEVLDHALRMVQHQVDEKLSSLDRRFTAAPDAVTGDDYQLQQAFMNLILNALEAMGPNGTLAVRTEFKVQSSKFKVERGPGNLQPSTLNSELGTRNLERPPAWVSIEFQDTGVGVAAENMNRLFEPFFTTKRNGTGLGLAICRRIVQEHHGDISVQSEPNKGTTFTISLPASGATP